MQTPPSPNNYENANVNPTVITSSSSHHASNNPSPWCNSDGEFWLAGDHRLGFSGDMGSEEDDLVSAYLNLDKIGGSEDYGGAASCLVEPSSGGKEKEKVVGRDNKSGDSLGGSGVVEVVSYEAKKAIPPEKLAEMWTVDPKRVKRILANRQSAARSKERKARYIAELERKLYSLQSEATNLSAQLKIYQRDTTALISENAELKIRLQHLEYQAHFRDVVNEALKHEVERLKSGTGEMRTPGSDPLSLRIAYSPGPSSSTLQTMSPYSPGASPSTRNTANLFPLPRKQVPMLAPLPPFPSPSSRRRQANKIARPEQNESVQGLEMGNRGLSSSLVNMDLGPPLVSPRNDHSSSTRPLKSP